MIPLFLSIAYAGSSEKTIEKAVDLIILCLTVFGVHYWASRRPDSAVNFGRSVLIFCLVLGMMIAVIAAATADLSSRMAFGEGGPNTFVRIVGVTALACLGLKLIPRPLAIILTIGLLTLVLLTQSRGGLVACVAALGVLFLRTFSWRSQFAYVGAFVAGLVGIATFTEIGRHCVDIVNERFINLTIHDGYTAGRSEIYEDSYQIWMEHFFFGSGLNAWWDRIGIYPHNIFLELGCDAGVIAVFAFVVLLSFYVYESLRTRDPIKIVLSSACLLYLIAAQFSGDIYDSRSLFIFGTILLAGRADAPGPDVEASVVAPTVTRVKHAAAATIGPEWSLHPASRHH
jgi:O-antigen ligase